MLLMSFQVLLLVHPHKVGDELVFLFRFQLVLTQPQSFPPEGPAATQA